MKVPPSGLFTQATKSMSDTVTAPTGEVANSDFGSMVAQESAGETADITALEGLSEEGELSVEAMLSLAGLAPGLAPTQQQANATPEGPTGSFLSPAAVGGITSFAASLAGLTADAEAGPAPIPGAAALLQSNPQAMAALPGEQAANLGTPLALQGAEMATQATTITSGFSVADAIPDTPAQLSESNVVDLSAAEQAPTQAVDATQARFGESLTGRGDNSYTMESLAANASRHLNRHLSHKEPGEAKIDTLGETNESVSDTSDTRAFAATTSKWREAAPIPEVRIKRSEALKDTDVSSEEVEQAELPEAAKLIQRSATPHRLRDSNKSLRVDADPNIADGHVEKAEKEGETIEVAEVFEEAAHEASEAATPEGIVRNPTEMQIDIDGELTVEIETNGDEVHINLDGTRSALDDMKGVRSEIADALDEHGLDLSEFSTTARDDENAQKSSSTSGDSGEQGGAAAENGANVATSPELLHGSSVSAVA